MHSVCLEHSSVGCKFHTCCDLGEWRSWGEIFMGSLGYLAMPPGPYYSLVINGVMGPLKMAENTWEARAKKPCKWNTVPIVGVVPFCSRKRPSRPGAAVAAVGLIVIVVGHGAVTIRVSGSRVHHQTLQQLHCAVVAKGQTHHPVVLALDRWQVVLCHHCLFISAKR